MRTGFAPVSGRCGSAQLWSGPLSPNVELTKLVRRTYAQRVPYISGGLVERPMIARGDQNIAVPTLVRRLPTPVKKSIGDLSNIERVLVGLDLRPAGGWR